MNRRLALAYRRLPSPLHAARAAAGGVYCAALVTAALVLDHPLALAALLLAVAGAALAAGAGRALVVSLQLALPVLLLVIAINALVSRNGLTVIARLGDVPPLGQIDITLEAIAYGAVYGLKLLVIVFAAVLLTVAVDPDELLRLARRTSFRSALTATLATRLVPVLADDAQRLADAQRCRPDAGAPGPAARVAILRAVAAGALDRATDVAATLEVRGFGSARRLPRQRRPASRHDLAFAAAALALIAAAVAGRALGLARFSADPQLHVAFGANEALFAVALIALALAPFIDRRGIEP